MPSRAEEHDDAKFGRTDGVWQDWIEEQAEVGDALWKLAEYQGEHPEFEVRDDVVKALTALLDRWQELDRQEQARGTTS